MQHRMKTHQLTPQQADNLLHRSSVGSLATNGTDGCPYTLPVHYIYLDGKIYLHGLPKGQKLANIAADSRVSFNVYDMTGFIMDDGGKICDTNTAYESVVISGTAALITDNARKKSVLDGIIAKYTPRMAGAAYPDNMLSGTAVVEITPKSITGKYYR